VSSGGNDYGEERTWFVRPSFLLTPTDTTEIVLRGEHGKITGDGGVVQSTSVYGGVDTGPGSEGSIDIAWDQAVLEANWDVGPGRFTGVLGWRDLEHVGFTDIDGLTDVLFHGGVKTLQDQFSAE